ncbi:MAG: FkbM family methyltransferase [Mucilaginibacter sp.]
MKISTRIKKFFLSIGLDVKKYRPDTRHEVLFSRMLNQFDINVIFDIGANEGQFASLLREVGYVGRIVSFEPLSAAYQKLVANSKKDQSWQVAPQMAIGDQDGEITINIANNSESSSILNMLDSHTDADERTAYIGNEQVCISKLDSIYSKYIDNNSKIFLKIDTQGYEDQVLNGAKELLGKAVGLQLEASLTPLYGDQKLFDEIISSLKKKGFEVWSIIPVFSNPRTGRQLQVDITFFRAPEINK